MIYSEDLTTLWLWEVDGALAAGSVAGLLPIIPSA